MSLLNRLTDAWNAFRKKDTDQFWTTRGSVSSYRPDRTPGFSTVKARGLITPIYNRISMDVADVPIKHIKVDPETERFVGEVKDDINERLNLSANLDQTGKAFIQDVTFSMFDEGVIAIAPIDVDKEVDPNKEESFKILSWRCGRIVQWAPDQVQIHLYDERTGQYEDLWYMKRSVAIIQNPFFEIMNAPNSILQRLLSKMALLDRIDSESATGRLDLIIQLPYVVKSDARKKQATQRRKEIIDQLTEQKYGIAYTDGTEKITQLSRPIENSLPQQIQELWTQLYNNLYMTPEILNGTANDQTMINYYARVIAPCLDAIVDEANRKFLTKTAWTQGHRIRYYRDYFKLVPVEKMADIADRFTRNEILTSNEVRQIIGFAPVDAPQADELRNKNLNRVDNELPMEMGPYGEEEQYPMEENYEEGPQMEPPGNFTIEDANTLEPPGRFTIE